MRSQAFVAALGAALLAGCTGRPDPNTAAQLEKLVKEVAELHEAVKQLSQTKTPTAPVPPVAQPAVQVSNTGGAAAPKKCAGTATLKDGMKRPFADLSGLRWKVISTSNYQEVRQKLPGELYMVRSSDEQEMQLPLDELKSLTVAAETGKGKGGNVVLKLTVVTKSDKTQEIEANPFAIVIRWADSIVSEEYLYHKFLGTRFDFDAG